MSRSAQTVKSKVAQASSTIVLKPLGDGELINMRSAIVIGRSTSCDVVVNRSFMSRQHAKLVPGKWEVIVEDLGSVNGTYVNDKKVNSRVRAKHKDTIRFDTLVYEVRIVVDIDDIALIDNTRPPQSKKKQQRKDKRGSSKKKSVEQALTSSEESDTDDLPIINDTCPPVLKKSNLVTRPSAGGVKTINKKSTRKGGVSPHDGSRKKSVNKIAERADRLSSNRSVAPLSSNGESVSVPLKKASRKSPSSKKPAALDTAAKQQSGNSHAESRVAISADSKESLATGPADTLRDKPERKRQVVRPSWALADQPLSRRTGSPGGDQVKYETVQFSAVSGDSDIFDVFEGGDAAAVLVGLSASNKGKVFPLHFNDNRGKWEVGRAETSDVMVVDPSVSRNHAQLVYDQKHWKLIDLMSANGTYVNGEKSLTCYLNSGDTVRFGKQEFRFKASEDQIEESDKREELTVWGTAIFAVVVVVVLIGFFSNSL